MKKTLCFVFILITILLCAVSAGAESLYYNGGYHEYNGGAIGLKINGKKVDNLPVSPVIINQFTMVPVREIFEALGSEVVWNDASRSVEIRSKDTTIYVAIGDRNAYVNDKLVVIEEPQPVPMLIGYEQSNLKTMVPVRFVAERLGFNVEWDDLTRTVLISDKKTAGNNGAASEMPVGEGNFGDVTAESDSRYDYVYISTQFGISPKIVKYPSPERIVIDFPKAQFISRNGSINLGGNSVSSVRYSNHEDMARVVLDITAPTQAFIMSSNRGILIRTEKSNNDVIVYDAFSQRVYFDKAYAGSGKATNNGYNVNFTNLKLSDQKISVNDGIISEIVVTSTASGCSVLVTGNSKLNYTAEKGFHLSATRPAQPAETPTTSVNKKNAIVIDAGHGGTDPGAIGYNSNGTVAAYESKVNLAIALMVGEKLKNSGYDVVFTRDEDVYISLKERADLANETECALFVSIHCNSIEKSSVNGTQVYYHPASETGTVLAKNIYDEVVKTTGLKPMNVQNGSHLYVIRSTISPSVLVETAFISNPSDRQYLASQKGQSELAEAIYQGIIKTIE